MPAQFLCQPAAHDRADECPKVYAHVEDCETGVAPRSAVRIQLAHERAHIRLENAAADDDEHQSEIESLRHGQSEREMTDGDNDAAVPYRPLRAPEPVGKPSAGKRHEVNRRGVKTVNGRGRRVAHFHSLHGIDHEQNQQRPHSVVAEPLPHFREEQRIESRRVFLWTGCCRRRRTGFSHHSGTALRQNERTGFRLLRRKRTGVKNKWRTCGLPGLLEPRPHQLGQVFHRHRTVIQHRFVIAAQLKPVAQLALDLLAHPVMRHSPDEIRAQLR